MTSACTLFALLAVSRRYLSEPPVSVARRLLRVLALTPSDSHRRGPQAGYLCCVGYAAFPFAFQNPTGTPPAFESIVSPPSMGLGLAPVVTVTTQPGEAMSLDKPGPTSGKDDAIPAGAIRTRASVLSMAAGPRDSGDYATATPRGSPPGEDSAMLPAADGGSGEPGAAGNDIHYYLHPLTPLPLPELWFGFARNGICPSCQPMLQLSSFRAQDRFRPHFGLMSASI